MIFLDLEIPEYVSMRIQESKTPGLLKTIRGKGVVENSNEFGYDERLHLNFIVNEKNLIKLMKLQARFQTLCLIPMYSKNLKTKIFNSYLEYQKKLLDTFLLNAGMEETEQREKTLDEVYNKNAEFLGLECLKELDYKINPNVNDCMMVFLESFSVKTIQDSSNGFEVEMIIWVCNDLTFFNGKEQEFLENYYKKFHDKKHSFDLIDKEVENIFNENSRNNNINLIFGNAWNEQTTYNPEKKFEKKESPTELNVIGEYIQQIEVRMMNNLVRLPIVGKPKGFIQHLGKGEIGITVKLALNQKNAIEEKIIHQAKSLALFEQEYITVSDCDFYLFKSFDIKELSICTTIIEEPNDDVDVTVLTLFFVAASTNKNEIDADYFTVMERANNTKTIKYFSNFLDIVLTDDTKIKLNDRTYNEMDKDYVYSDKIFKEFNTIDSLNLDKKNKDKLRKDVNTKKMSAFSNIIISKSNKKTNIEEGTREDINNLEKNDFTLMDLILTYRQYRIGSFIACTKSDSSQLDFKVEDLDKYYEVPSSTLAQGGARIFMRENVRVVKDNMYYDVIKFRLQNLAYRFLLSYNNTDNETYKNLNYDDLYKLEESTQAKFVDDVMKYFVIDFFELDAFKDIRKRFITAISHVFKIEVFNSFCVLLKSIFDDKECDKYLGTFAERIPILINSEFNIEVKNFLFIGMMNAFNKMEEIIKTTDFKSKVLIYVKTNWYDNSETIADTSIQKALDVEIDKFINRYSTFKTKISAEKFDNNLFNLILLIFKLELLGIKFDKTDLMRSVQNNNNKANTTDRTDNRGYSNDNELLFKATIEGAKERLSTDQNSRSYLYLNSENQCLLLTDMITSLLMADISYERSVIGVIATESAKNFVGPFSITYAAIKNEIGVSNDKIRISKGNKDLETFKTTANEEELKTIDRLNKFLYLESIIERMFGNEALNYFLESSSSFIRTTTNNRDFQRIFGIQVFSNFESPMEFLKDISVNTKTYRGLFDWSLSMLNDLDKKANQYKEGDLINSFNKEKDENLQENVDKIKEDFLSTNEKIKILNGETINKQESASSFMSTPALQTELLSEFKYVRALRSAAKLMTTQYEMMMPDYEIYVIDEKEIETASYRGYDLQNKIYALRNVLSVNIKKDDNTNIKTAIVKILNVKPFDIGLNTIFENKNIINDDMIPIKNENGEIVMEKDEYSEIVYGNKFTTKRMAFKPGLLINISLDPRSNYYDFTGKIESVNLTKTVITLTCSSFASELLGKSFDMDNKYLYGLFNTLGATWNSIKDLFYERGQGIGRSRIENINKYIIPDKIYTDLSSKEGDTKTQIYDKSIAGATGMIYTALEKAGESLKHFYTPYNDLLQGRNISTNFKKLNSTLGNSKFFSEMAEHDSMVASRLVENVNAVDFDISFYGISSYKTAYEGYSGKQGSSAKINHSSFIANDTFTLRGVPIVEGAVGNGVDINYNYEQNVSNDPLSDMYCYERPGVKVYDVLNDIQLRNPAAYWDVIESGHYATLFLGRNNYMIKRKNKTSTLTKTEIERMCNFIDYFLKQHDTLLTYTNELYIDQIIDYTNLFRSLAAIYDTSYQFDEYIINLMKKFNNENPIEVTYNDDNENISKNIEGYDLASNIHLAVSGYNLLACDIKTNENYCNTVDLIYSPTFSDRIGRWFQLEFSDANRIKLHSFKDLPQERERTKIIDSSFTTDIHNKYQGFEYAQSVLMKEFRNYYDGKIATLYIPDLKKNDEILLIDSKNSITGTVVVKDFQHIMDVESGLITIITPGMKTSTSSLINDLYLTGLISELEYDYKSSNSNRFDVLQNANKDFTKANQSAAVLMKELFGKVKEGMPQIPITYDNSGFNFDYNKNTITKNEKDAKNINSLETSDENKKSILETKFLNSDEWTNVQIPRNQNDLPFKIYPLIQNGQPMIPDYDIYNTKSNENSTVKRLIAAFLYSFFVLGSASKALSYVGDAFKQLVNYLDLSDKQMYENIISTFLPGFEKYSLDKYDKESLAAILVSDNLYSTAIETANIVFIKEIADKYNMAFFNCQKLNQFEDNRIEKIAAILIHFTLINLVELDGRKGDQNDISKIEFEDSNFTVVNKLVQKMNDLSIKYKLNKKFEVFYQDRLLADGPVKTSEYAYDDIGAVITEVTDIYTLSHGMTETVNAQVGENGKSYNVSRNFLSYLISFKTDKIDCVITKAFVFHNYYGSGDISEMTASYAVRTKLISDLMKQADKNNNKFSNFAVIGDFNLNVLDRIVSNSLGALDFANNNIYVLDKTNIKVANRNNLPTTIGKKAYDNFIFTDGSNLLDDVLEKNSIYHNTGMFKIFKNYYKITENIEPLSDHYPIYVDFEMTNSYNEKQEIIKNENLIKDNITSINNDDIYMSNMNKDELLKNDSKLRAELQNVMNKNSDIIGKTKYSIDKVINSSKNGLINSFLGGLVFGPVLHDINYPLKNYFKGVEGVDVRLIYLMEQVLEESEIKFNIISGLRTKKEQLNLLNKKTETGARVTSTMCSFHLIGRAIDIKLEDGSYSLNKFRKINEIVQRKSKNLDLRVKWGGEWVKLVDGPHFELHSI